VVGVTQGVRARVPAGHPEQAADTCYLAAVPVTFDNRAPFRASVIAFHGSASGGGFADRGSFSPQPRLKEAARDRITEGAYGADSGGYRATRDGEPDANLTRN
jgi:hypothetical protein